MTKSPSLWRISAAAMSVARSAVTRSGHSPATIRAIVEALQAEQTAMIASATAARDEATHPEAKAESKYDTRAIEALGQICANVGVTMLCDLGSSGLSRPNEQAQREASAARSRRSPSPYSGPQVPCASSYAMHENRAAAPWPT